jgi:hypothetical protein
MKILKYIYIPLSVMVLTISCQKGIDPISKVDPGPDTAAPAITISYPIEGTKIRVDEPVTSINIKFTAVDDIEIKAISLKMDGTEIASFNSFKDYRRYIGEFQYNNVTDGQHALSVTVTDLSDKETTKTVNFKKVAAYVPLDGEVMYLPFDGDYFELVGKKEVTVKGLPTFVPGHLEQGYAGAVGAGMTYPAPASLMNSSEISVVFWYKEIAPIVTPDPSLRGGIFSICTTYPGKSTDNPMFYNDTLLQRGIRIFHENSGTKLQNIGMNIGIGANWVWSNPMLAVKYDATNGNFGGWQHIAISISATNFTVYINGVVKVKTTALAAPISWTGCNLISIGSGEPNFVFWSHLSDLSQIDELHVFKRAITAAEVTSLYSMK